MRLSSNGVFGAIAVASIIIFALILGSLWVIDASVLAAIALAITVYCLRRIDWSTPAEDFREYAPRSRIAHYLSMSKIRTSIFTVDSYDEFEKALLERGNWMTMSTEELGRVSRTPSRGRKAFRQRRHA